MRLGCRSLVLLPDFDRLITLSSYHASGRPVEEDVKDGSLTRKRPRLQGGLDLLEIVARLPVEEVKRAIVGPTNHDVVGVDGKRIKHGWVVWNRPHLLPLWTLPDPDLVSTCGSKRVVRGVICEGSNTLFVVSQSLADRARPDVPEFDHFVVGARDNLRLVVLHDDALNDVSVTCQAHNLVLSANVPKTDSRVSASSRHDIHGRVESQCKDAT